MPHVKPRLGPGWAVTFVALGLVVPLLAVMGLRFQMVKETRTKAEAYEAFKLATTELHSTFNGYTITQINTIPNKEVYPVTFLGPDATFKCLHVQST